MFLQESDVFMDALTAANLLKEPRKRKRRTSGSKDGTGPPEPKKELTSPNANSTPPSSPLTDEKISPTNLKPSFKFYQETMDTSVDHGSDSKVDAKNNHKVKKEIKTEDEDEKEENLEFAEPRNAEDNEDSSNSTNEDAMAAGAESYENRQRIPLGVLVYTKTRREPKKRVSWKMDDELETVRFFDLDETERVNVTKTFTDMKQMERSNEREQMLIARKLPTHDIMEERTQWRLLIPIDIPPKGQVITPGKNSHEKDIQYAREKTVLQAIYFNKRLIPDSPAEPDLEIHATTDPTLIPLDDTSGNGDSINDFTTLPWPESRYAPEPLLGPGPPQSGFHPMSGGPIHPVQFQPPQPYTPGPYPYPPLPPNQPPANWTNGVQPEMFPMGGMMPAGPMPPRSLLGHPATDMGFHPAMGVGGPSDGPPFMYGPTPSPAMYNQPPRFQGPWFGTPQGHGHLGEGNRGGNRGGYGHWRGGGHDSSQRNSSWGNNSNRRVCKNIINKGFCRTSNCPFQHPKDS